MAIRKPTVVSPDASGRYEYYCRQCGQIHTQKDFPVYCKRCGNTEVNEGFGVSGDAGVSNTTETVTWVSGTWKKIGTIDKQRR